MKFIPKVGEWCTCKYAGGSDFFPCVLTDSDIVLIDKHEFICRYNLDSTFEFKPIKTPDEIDRDEAINKLLKIINGGDGDKWSLDLANKLYDAGFHKQQVKPLMTRSEFILICESERWVNDIYEKVKGRVIQGGDK